MKQASVVNELPKLCVSNLDGGISFLTKKEGSQVLKALVGFKRGEFNPDKKVNKYFFTHPVYQKRDNLIEVYRLN